MGTHGLVVSFHDWTVLTSTKLLGCFKKKKKKQKMKMLIFKPVPTETCSRYVSKVLHGTHFDSQYLI